MKQTIVLSALITATLVALITTPLDAQTQQDPWYSDIPPHYWAYRNIRVLWEENVSDGYVYYDSVFPENTFAKFLPKEDCTRGQFVMMLAKIFQLPYSAPDSPSFADVQPNFCLYHSKPAYAFIEAAREAGFLQELTGPFFYPHQPITREEAAVKLIRSLGLAEYAHAMTKAEVDRILIYFSDHHNISIQYRHYLATAVKFHILYGYGRTDRELRPKRVLARDEAAVILYRSCLVRAHADPDTFNPYLDGEHATTIFRITPLKNRNLTSGYLNITSEDLTIIHRTLVFADGVSEMDLNLVWDGTSDSGDLLPPGTYYYICSMVDRKNQSFSSPPKPVAIDMKVLEASLNPVLIRPGEKLNVNAVTLPDASSVSAVFEDGTIISLKTNPFVEGTHAHWSGNYEIPADALEKEHTTVVKAVYPHSVLFAHLSYRVTDPIHLRGSLHPYSLRAGEKIHIEAETSLNVISIDACFPFGDPVPLVHTAPGIWQGDTRIPLDTDNGLYTVHLKASTHNKSSWFPLHYEVNGNLLGNVRFILSD